MLDIFENTTKEKQLKILNAHPELADKTKIGSLTPDSQKEQSNAGLDQCSEDEFNEFRNLNDEYKKKFGFPFILAVKGRTKIEILNNFRQRVSSDANTEFNQTIKQVKQIASLRLKELNKKNI
jgi:OHCU decarboxylase